MNLTGARISFWKFPIMFFKPQNASVKKYYYRWYTKVEHAKNYNVFYEIQKAFSVSLHCHQTSHMGLIFSVTQLFEAITIAKFGISDCSTATYIPSPSLFVAWSNVIVHLVLFLPRISRKLQKYPLALIRVICVFKAYQADLTVPISCYIF